MSNLTLLGAGGPAGLALPTVTGRSKNVSSTANATSYSVTLPSGIVAGEVLVVLVAADGQGTLSESSGLWTQIGQLFSSTVHTATAFWKIADGSDTLTVSNTAAEQYSHMAWRVSNANTVNATGLSSVATTDANPPSHTPPAGTKDYLWIAGVTYDGTVNATTGPAGYSNFDTQASSGGSGAGCAAAERSTNASSEDPGTFTNASTRWIAYTFAVYQN